MKKDETTNTGDEAMIEELLQHLDSEFAQGVYRMSVSFDEKEEEPKNVSRKCCNMYGRPRRRSVCWICTRISVPGSLTGRYGGRKTVRITKTV